jgi:hypothetical protein
LVGTHSHLGTASAIQGLAQLATPVSSLIYRPRQWPRPPSSPPSPEDRGHPGRLDAIFELIRHHGTLGSAVHFAFDLLELDGRDLRREPIGKRKGLVRFAPKSGIAGLQFDVGFVPKADIAIQLPMTGLHMEAALPFISPR